MTDIQIKNAPYARLSFTATSGLQEISAIVAAFKGKVVN
jgi:hypothetical protein